MMRTLLCATIVMTAIASCSLQPADHRPASATLTDERNVTTVVKTPPCARFVTCRIDV